MGYANTFVHKRYYEIDSVHEDVVVMECNSDEFGTDYRFGFNGQQKENNIKGLGNHNTAMFWEYDTRLGRRWNLDPVDQVSISNYAAFANNPIFYKDVLGNTVKGTTDAAKKEMETYGEKTYINKRGKEKVNEYYEPEFGKMYEKWKNDPNVLVNFNTQKGDGTIGYEGKNEDGQDVYNVTWDPSITPTLGASGIFEESYHLKEATEGVEMAFAKNSDGSYGVAGLDIYDEVRAKQWVGLSIKSFRDEYNLGGNQYGYTHYGFIKSLNDKELVKKYLMEGAPYLKPKERIDMNINTTMGGTSTKFKTYQPSHFGPQYRNFSPTEKKP